MVITLTNLPAEIEEALQRKAAAEGKSVDRVTLDIIARGLSLDSPEEGCQSDPAQQKFAERVATVKKTLNDAFRIPNQKRDTTFHEEQSKATLQPGTKRDLSFLAKDGPLEPEVLQALEDQRQIDPDLWQ
jgi:plasmid stability protein